MGYTDHGSFLMFGDSITEYAFDQNCGDGPASPVQFVLGPALQNAYTRRLTVLQRGFSGYTSRDALPLIKSILKCEHDEQRESRQVKIAYVFFGTNDARHKGTGSDNNETIPLDKFLSNMTQVVAEFKNRNIPVIVITPGVHDQQMWDKSDPEDLITGDYRTNERNKLYQDSLRDELVNTYPDVPVLSLYDVMVQWVAEKPESRKLTDMLSDGIHLSGIGYKVLYDNIMAIINKHYPTLAPENMEFKFPHRSQITDDTWKNIE